MRIVYPKFKNGEATVREVKLNQTFGMSKPNFNNFSILTELLTLPFPTILLI